MQAVDAVAPRSVAADADLPRPDLQRPPSACSAVRAHDPFQKTVGRWIIRRLSPDSNPVEIAELPKSRDEETLVHAMGMEAANVHLGTKMQVGNILKDLHRKKPSWLRSAAKVMAKAIEKEWKDYRKM